MNCISNSCNINNGNTVISSDATKIYNIVNIAGDKRVLFTIYNSTDGSIIGNRYQTSDNLATKNQLDIYVNGTNVYILMLFGTTTVFFQYDEPGDSWNSTIYSFPTVYGRFVKNNYSNM